MKREILARLGGWHGQAQRGHGDLVDRAADDMPAPAWGGLGHATRHLVWIGLLSILTGPLLAQAEIPVNVVAEWQSPDGGGVAGVAVAGRYAYVVDHIPLPDTMDRGITGVHVLDVSNPASPYSVGEFHMNGASAELMGLWDGYLCMNYTDRMGPGVGPGYAFVDISNPASPHYEAGWWMS